MSTKTLNIPSPKVAKRDVFAMNVPKQNVIPQTGMSISQKQFAVPGHAQSLTIVKYKNGGTAVTTAQSARVYVESPSSRLRVSLAVVLEAENFTPIGDPAWEAGKQPTLYVSSMVRNPDNGQLSYVSQVFPQSGTLGLPQGYEADTAASVLRVNVANLLSSAVATTFQGAYASGYLKVANLNLIARWEPNVEMSDDEAKRLFEKCKVWGDSQFYTSSGPSQYGPGTVFALAAVET